MYTNNFYAYKRTYIRMYMCSCYVSIYLTSLLIILKCRVGDAIESVNDIDLSCVFHKEAVKAIKESKEALHLVVRRRKGQHVALGCVLQAAGKPSLLATQQPHQTNINSSNQTETHEFAILVQKEGVLMHQIVLIICMYH